MNVSIDSLKRSKCTVCRNYAHIFIRRHLGVMPQESPDFDFVHDEDCDDAIYDDSTELFERRLTQAVASGLITEAEMQEYKRFGPRTAKGAGSAPPSELNIPEWSVELELKLVYRHLLQPGLTQYMVPQCGFRKIDYTGYLKWDRANKLPLLLEKWMEAHNANTGCMWGVHPLNEPDMDVLAYGLVSLVEMDRGSAHPRVHLGLFCQSIFHQLIGEGVEDVKTHHQRVDLFMQKVKKLFPETDGLYNCIETALKRGVAFAHTRVAMAYGKSGLAKQVDHEPITEHFTRSYQRPRTSAAAPPCYRYIMDEYWKLALTEPSSHVISDLHPLRMKYDLLMQDICGSLEGWTRICEILLAIPCPQEYAEQCVALFIEKSKEFLMWDRAVVKKSGAYETFLNHVRPTEFNLIPARIGSTEISHSWAEVISTFTPDDVPDCMVTLCYLKTLCLQMEEDIRTQLKSLETVDRESPKRTKLDDSSARAKDILCAQRSMFCRLEIYVSLRLKDCVISMVLNRCIKSGTFSYPFQRFLSDAWYTPSNAVRFYGAWAEQDAYHSAQFISHLTNGGVPVEVAFYRALNFIPFGVNKYINEKLCWVPVVRSEAWNQLKWM